MSYRLELWDNQKLVVCWDHEEMMDLLFHEGRGHALQDDLLTLIDEREEEKVVGEVNKDLNKGTGLL